jgi:hypothetical protein
MESSIGSTMGEILPIKRSNIAGTPLVPMEIAIFPELAWFPIS